ncbi:hypothetical protein ACFWUZ_30765 [Streptomyces sp. NPDC058646]|uniref:hypothetical protein n=1 Tax=Streptomyces sp. NPDC058646 TaxID=3346574 RepID=UPI00364B291A
MRRPVRAAGAGLDGKPVSLARFWGQVFGADTRALDRAAAQPFVRAHGLTLPSLHDPVGELLLPTRCNP